MTLLKTCAAEPSGPRYPRRPACLRARPLITVRRAWQSWSLPETCQPLSQSVQMLSRNAFLRVTSTWIRDTHMFQATGWHFVIQLLSKHAKSFMDLAKRQVLLWRRRLFLSTSLTNIILRTSLCDKWANGREKHSASGYSRTDLL